MRILHQLNIDRSQQARAQHQESHANSLRDQTKSEQHRGRAAKGGKKAVADKAHPLFIPFDR